MQHSLFLNWYLVRGLQRVSTHPSREKILDSVHGVATASSYLVSTTCNTVGYMLSMLFFFNLVRRIVNETEN